MSDRSDVASKSAPGRKGLLAQSVLTHWRGHLLAGMRGRHVTMLQHRRRKTATSAKKDCRVGRLLCTSAKKDLATIWPFIRFNQIFTTNEQPILDAVKLGHARSGLGVAPESAPRPSINTHVNFIKINLQGSATAAAEAERLAGPRLGVATCVT